MATILFGGEVVSKVAAMNTVLTFTTAVHSPTHMTEVTRYSSQGFEAKVTKDNGQSFNVAVSSLSNLLERLK